MRDHFSLFKRSFKYWDIFLSWLFKYPTRCYTLKKGKQSILYDTLSKTLTQFGKSAQRNNDKKGIICQFTPSLKDVKQVIDLLHAIHEEIKNPMFCEWAVAEVLAKVLAYRRLKEGLEILIPTREKKAPSKMGLYRVGQVFELWNKIQAFGLERQDANGAHILLFRGTDLSLKRKEGRASILSDFDPKGPGWTLFEKGKTIIQQWLEEKSHPTRVIGHSLGGVVAAYTLIHEAKWMSQEPYESSYAFNFPGISQSLLNQWDGLKDKPAFTGFISRGDLISKFGLLFGKVYEVSSEAPLSPIQAHERLVFSEKKGRIHEVDLAKENGSKSRNFYTKVQKHVTSTLYPVFKNRFFKDH